MPLTQKVTFTAMLQRGKRVQIPKLIRWQFKMEPNQVLKVGVNAINVWTGWQFFYAKMGKDGRILIPKLTLALLRSENPNLIGYIMEITLEPA
jgi:bifunctional DNA-binding transcriptional regulator/antitoxin component of YhaV-PrlF toxin-antitoxin module